MTLPVPYDNGGYRSFGFKLGNGFHCGHDFNVKLGTPVKAILDGVIVFSGSIMGFGSMNPDKPGGVVVMRHEDKNGFPFHAVYGHVNSVHIVGDPLKEGEVIGHVAAFTSGGELLPHLHFGIYPGDSIPNYPWGYVTASGLTRWADPKKFLLEKC